LDSLLELEAIILLREVFDLSVLNDFWSWGVRNTEVIAVREYTACLMGGVLFRLADDSSEALVQDGWGCFDGKNAKKSYRAVNSLPTLFL
jgi:hypothetical protein